MFLRRFESGTHGVDGGVGGAEIAPRFSALVKLVLVETFDADPRIDAEVLSVTACGIERLMQQVEMPFETVIGSAASRKPAIT